MTLAIAYAILVSAAMASLAAVVDLVLRSRQVASRWTWMLALMLAVPLTAFVMLAPEGVEVTQTAGQIHETASTVPAAPFTAVATPGEAPYLAVADLVLTWAWMAASLLLLLAIGLGQWHLVRARRRAHPGRVRGHPVLLTEDIGPAVAGIAQPVVLLPRWVTALDEASQHLLLAHEFEHARKRDTMLLMGGAIAAALLPWNPVVWWLTWRLRVAVELDCDRRVLAANPAIRQYVDLLLLAAGRNRLSARLLAAHFGEYSSDLERRICAMTESKLRLRPVVATMIVSAALLAVACETPRPDPVAPGLTTGLLDGPGQPVESERRVAQPVRIAEGSMFPRYPEILRQAGVEGTVLVSFVVNEQGMADIGSLKVMESTHELFAVAVRAALPGMRFKPAEDDGRIVARRVEQPFTFTLVGSGQAPSEVPEIEERRAPSVVLRSERQSRVTPNILVKSINGTELRRYIAEPGKMDAKSALGDIDPQDIEAIEVYKPTACPANAAVPCPLIVVTVKRGREAAYRAR
jgi:TonB family protein